MLCLGKMLAERIRDARAVLARAEKSWRGNVSCFPGKAGGVVGCLFGGMALSRNISIGGFVPVGMHEVICAHDGGAASILAWYLARIAPQEQRAGYGRLQGCEQDRSQEKPQNSAQDHAQSNRSVFWVRQRRAIDQGGFYHLALPVGQATDPPPLMMTVDQQDIALWSCEEAAKSGQVASIILETTDYDLTSARRLQLACEAGGTRMIVLRRASHGGRLMPSSALTRWKIEPAPSTPDTKTGNIHHLSLIGGRGVRPGSWKVKTDASTFSLSVVDPLEDGLSENQQDHGRYPPQGGPGRVI